MKERPILFSGEMVRAILAGRKTQTRRVVKPQPKWIADPNIPFKTDDANPKGIIKCPYGQPGNFLWVRETWATWSSLNHLAPSGIRPKPALEYKADGCLTISGGKIADRGKWRPSIHMPRWASRITLEITDVRVERVQDISEYDAECEGAETASPKEATGARFRPAFHDLWDSINAKRGLGWNANPWIWCLTFVVV
ncbi:MAG: hypothetical protein WC373_16650 [Smithella sp.]|jgi:hypothetical protein